MGELEPWIDENFVRSVWFGMGYQVNVKMIRDKFSGSEINITHCVETRADFELVATPAIASSILKALMQLPARSPSTAK